MPEGGRALRRRPDIPPGDRRVDGKKPPRRRWGAVAAGLVVPVLVLGGLWLGFVIRDPRHDPLFGLTRVRNALSFYVLGGPPRVYGLTGERNGRDFRLNPSETFAVTYRDEFILHGVVSDDLLSRGVSVDIAGVGGERDEGRILRGVDLVDRAMAERGGPEGATRLPAEPIRIRYRETPIAAIPVQAVVTPQDWLRHARASDSLKERIDYLEAAIRMNPADTNVRKMLGGIYLRSGEIERAIRHYGEVIRRNPQDLTALRELLKAYEAGKDDAAVIRTGERLLALSPGEASIYAHMAFASGNLGRWPRAVDLYRKSLALDPRQEALHFRLGEAHEMTGDYPAAIEAYRAILKRTPDADYARMALAAASLKASRNEEAIRLYRDIVKRQPRNALAYANLALALGNKGLTREEVAYDRKALAIEPGNAIVRFNLAAAYEKLKMDREAAQEYRQVLKLKPEEADALKRLADLEFRSGRFAAAAALYERLVKVSPQKADVHAQLGAAYAEAKKYGLAAENYEKALRFGKRDPQLRQQLADVYEKLGRKKEALAQYERAAAAGPADGALDVLADRYMEEGRYEEAVQTYRKLIALNPRRPSHHEALGYAYERQGKTGAAIEAYQASLKYDPENAEVLYRLGLLHERNRDYEDALQAFEKAYELNPEHVRAGNKIPRMKILLLERKMGERQ